MDESCTLAAVKHRDHVDLWSLSRRRVALPPVGDKDSLQDPSSPKAQLSCRLQLMDGIDRDHIHSVGMNPDGNVVAVTGGGADGGSLAAAGGLRLWYVHSEGGNGASAVRVKLPHNILEATSGERLCQSLCFSRDGRCLAVAVADCGVMNILLLDVTINDEKCDGEAPVEVSLRHKLHHSRSIQTSGRGGGREAAPLDNKLSGAIDSLSFSADGRWLAVSSCGTAASVYEVDRYVVYFFLLLSSH